MTVELLKEGKKERREEGRKGSSCDRPESPTPAHNTRRSGPRGRGAKGRGLGLCQGGAEQGLVASQIGRFCFSNDFYLQSSAASLKKKKIGKKKKKFFSHFFFFLLCKSHGDLLSRAATY